jgi:heme exporter protein C
VNSSIAFERDKARRNLGFPLTSLGVVTLISFLVALYAALVATPAERVEGNAFRIFYFHVPFALLTYVAFFFVLVGSLVYMWRQSQPWDRLARSAAEIGLLYCTLTLATGVLWGRPVWGVWWTWDARLTSTLVLWFIYLGYLMLRSYVEDRARAARYAAVLGVIGFLDVPIVQFSVNWWRTLHPESTVLASAGRSLPAPMLIALALGMLAVTLLFAFLLLLRLKAEQLRDTAFDLRLHLTSP